jgi:hypothetical protein
MAIAVGIAKQLVYKAQTALGSKASASGAQILRRVTSDIDLSKDTYESEEIRADYQVADMRHGMRKIEGTIAGEASVGSYNDFIAAALRQNFQTAATTGAIAVVTAAASAPQYVRSTGSFLTDGFKVGDVIRWTGFAATNNNSNNFLITALTATDMTGVHLNGEAVTAEAEGATVTGALVGKKTWTPITGHTDDYFTIEHNYSDITQSEQFTDCKVSTIDWDLPATGMAKINIGIMGLDMDTSTSAYFTSPTAATTGSTLAAVNGLVYIEGTAVALITGLKIAYDGGMTTEPVVGSNVSPDIFEGRVKITGEATVFFQDATFRDYFVNETEVSINFVLAGGTEDDADFMAFSMPRVKMGGSSKDDGEKGLTQTMPFVALLNSSGGTGINTEQTTLSIQDSLA